MFQRLRARLDDAHFLRTFHGYATIFWLFMCVPSVLVWKESIPYLVFVSVYALVMRHWSSWQASRVETNQIEDRLNAEEDGDSHSS